MNFNCVERKNIFIIVGVIPPFEGETEEESHNGSPGREIEVNAALDIDGNNYYDFQKELVGFPYTCVVNDAGIVQYIGADPSAISPGVGETVFGLVEYPEGVELNGEWRYSYETQTFAHDAQEAAQITLAANTGKRNHLQRIATEQAYPLQLRVSMGTATTEQVERLTALNGYILALDDMTPEQLSQAPAVFPTLAGIS